MFANVVTVSPVAGLTVRYVMELTSSSAPGGPLGIFGLCEPGSLAGRAGGQGQVDGELLRMGVGARLVLLDPALLGHGLERRRDLTLQRPQVERRLGDGELPVVAAVLDPGGDDLVEVPDPPFPDDRAGQGPRHLVDLDPDEAAVGITAHVERVRRDLFEEDDDIKAGDGDGVVDRRDRAGELLLVRGRVRVDRMMDLPERHCCSSRVRAAWSLLLREMRLGDRGHIRVTLNRTQIESRYKT